MLLESDCLQLVNAEVMSAIRLDESLDERLGGFEDTFRCKEPDSVDKCVHGNHIVQFVEALTKRFRVTNCSLSNELGVEFFSLCNLSIGEFPLSQAALQHKIAQNGRRCTDDGTAEGC